MQWRHQKAPHTQFSLVPKQFIKVRWRASNSSDWHPAVHLHDQALLVKTSVPTEWRELKCRQSLTLTCAFEVGAWRLFFRPRRGDVATSTRPARKTNEGRRIFIWKKSRKLWVLNASSSKSCREGVDTRTHTQHTYINTHYVIWFKQTWGLTEPLQGHVHGCWGYHLPCAHIRVETSDTKPGFNESLLCHTHAHTQTLSQTHTRGPWLPLLFQPRAPRNAYSRTGEALCAKGHDNCGSSCAVTFNPWQHGKVGALSCQDPSGASYPPY